MARYAKLRRFLRRTRSLATHLSPSPRLRSSSQGKQVSDTAMSHFSAHAANETPVEAQDPPVGDQGQRIGERGTSTGAGSNVSGSGWSDLPSALSYSSGANSLASAASGRGGADGPAGRPQESPSSNAPSSSSTECTCKDICVYHLRKRMACSGCWKGFRDTGGE